MRNIFNTNLNKSYYITLQLKFVSMFHRDFFLLFPLEKKTFSLEAGTNPALVFLV